MMSGGGITSGIALSTAFTASRAATITTMMRGARRRLDQIGIRIGIFLASVRHGGHRCGEEIAFVADRLDQGRVLRVGLDLAAQPADLHVDADRKSTRLN